MGASVGTALLAPARAAAQNASDPETDFWDGDYDIEYERRSDFTFGLATGLQVGNAAGYPNSVNDIGRDASEVDSGVAIGAGGLVFLGGALRDWFVIEVGVGVISSSGDADVSGTSFFFRTEQYPFWSLGEWGKDLGVSTTFGVGLMTAETEGKEKADGGATSFVGLGGFYELWHFGHFALGPSLEYSYTFSRAMRAHFTTIGARFAFYGGP